MQFIQFLEKIGVSKNQNVIVHSALRNIKFAFRNINPEKIISDLQSSISENGSLIMPTFTYNFKKKIGEYEIFDKEKSISKTGALTEIFRKTPNVKRTSSPTHSFAIWGKILNEINEKNSPESPLGKNSILEWLTENDSYILMLATDFSTLSLLHYYEIKFRVPWFNFSPWDYLHILPIGVSTDGEQKLIEIPGCSKSFTAFERFLEDKNIIEKHFYKGMKYYFIEIKKITAEAEFFFTSDFTKLLCIRGICEACDSRREKFISQ